MDCLDEDTILGFCRGGLAENVRVLAEHHISTCDECRQLVSAVARSSFVDSQPKDRTAPAPERDSQRNVAEPRPLLRARIDPAMAATTPNGASGHGPPASPVQRGEILAGKFAVERVLGAGGMGIVVAARHTQLDQRVALKFLLPVACEVPGAVARFLREGKAAARITSEHVARVMDTGVLDGGAPYLVMEYLEGLDLGALVLERGRIPVDDAIEYVLQACEAIVEAHHLGIVHRDLKPANLFLAHRADGSPLVKVLDFGISKVAGSGSRSQLTSASVLMGSPRYMSPEQMMSAKDVDARTDVWALGVILYELVSGQAVWHADTMQGLCALIASAPAPRLRVAVPDAPILLDEVVARCLTKTLSERIGSVAELAAALAPIAPAAARTSIERIVRVGRKERMTGPRSRPPAPVSAAVQTGDGVVAKAPAEDRGPGRRGLVLGIVVGVLLVAGIAINAGVARRGTGARATATVSAPVSATASAPASASATAGTNTAAREQVSASAPSAPSTGLKKAAAGAPAPSASSRALTDRK